MGYTFHYADLELFSLYRFGESDHLYWSINPGPKAASAPLSIFNGLYREANGKIVNYTPTHEFSTSTIADNRLYVKTRDGNLKLCGLSARKTHISLATNIDIDSIPSKTGVRYALNISENDFESLKNSLPPHNSNKAKLIEHEANLNYAFMRKQKPMFDTAYVDRMKAAYAEARRLEEID